MGGAPRTLSLAGGAAAYLEAGTGRPLVLIHGVAGRGEVWGPQLDGLADLARVVAVDLPGHGRSGDPARDSVDGYAAWLLGVLDAAGFERVVLGGHSMGGAIAQTLALAHPRRVAGLILVGTGARLRVAPRVLELFRDRPPEGVRLVGSLCYSPRTAPAAVAEADRARRETAADVALGDFRACDAFDVMGRLPTLRIPTVVVVGRDDQLTPPKYADYLARAIPGARLVEIEAAGHFVQLEQPAAVNAAIRGFLAGLGAAW